MTLKHLKEDMLTLPHVALNLLIVWWLHESGIAWAVSILVVAGVSANALLFMRRMLRYRIARL